MRYTIRTITAANLVPTVITVAQAKVHLRVETADEDELIEAQLRAAQEMIELRSGHVLTEREMEMALGGFPLLPELIQLPREPVTSVVSIAYTDGDGATVAMAGADWRWGEESPEVVKPAFQASWPVAAGEPGAVRVRFMAGYGDGLAPAALVAAVKLMLSHLYRNREAVTASAATELPMGVDALIGPYRRLSL